MKLISMTDFVLHESFGVGNEIIDKGIFYNKCRNYANFLKQPLKLEMFIPCDKDGNVLEEPKKDNFLTQSGLYQTDYHTESLKQYEQAKTKVLFEGFEVKGHYIMYYDFMYIMTYELENKNIESIIEKIPNNTLTLTQNAIKQLGL